MEDELVVPLDCTELGNLRVVDLKQELEKRGLSKSGSKKDLVKRLKQQLELEKLSRERKSSGDYDLKLELDADIEQNEFVQQYLAQQQKRKEEKRLELEAVQKENEEKLGESSEERITEDENPVSELDVAKEDENNKNKHQTDKSTNVVDDDGENIVHGANVLAVAQKDTSSALETDHTDKTTKHEIKVSVDCGEEENTHNTNNRETNFVLTKCHQTVSKALENSTEEKDTHNSKDPRPKIVLSETVTEVNDDENSDKIIVDEKSISSENAESPKHPIHITDISTEQNKQSLLPPVATSSEKSSDIESSCGQYIISAMESSQCTSVPYSLSDIQLPESPGNHSAKLSKSLKKEDKSNSIAKDEAGEKSHDSKAQRNGVSEALHSHHDEVSSEAEAKESSKSESSPEKTHCEKKEFDDNRQSERSEKSESSDAELDKNESYDEKRKQAKYEDTSSNVAADSEEEQSKDSSYKRQKSKSPKQSGESDNSKSTDSDKHSHRNSKHKSRDKRRKRNRKSRSRSSSSSSRSSDSSPKRRHPKKSVVTKSKNYTETDESYHKPAKSSDSKPVNNKNDSIKEEQVSVPSSTKRRLKIKRDNVSVEINSSNAETVDKAASKSTDFKTPHPKSDRKISVSYERKIDPDLHTEKSPVKPPKPELTEPKDAFSEITYVPRKLSLSYRKLSRKSSEDTEQKGKKGKWESFANSQKTSQTISISTDSLKTWFPDFKLMSEPTTPMELEPDEHSLPVGEEKSTDPSHMDASDGNDSAVRHGSTSQMEVEEGEAEESNFDETSEQGPVSKIIFIQNLVRPFTLNQLKDLLKQSGKIVEEYFWIDKIKSKCFVMYETEKEAAKARNALNNTRWPPSNPKILSVEFSNEEELENHKRGNDVPPKPIVDQPVVETHETEHRVHQSPEEQKRKDRDRRKDRERSKPQPPVREWDKDKIMQESPERDHTSKDEKSRSAEKKEKKEPKKRPNEDTPAKLLDDLFQKTKSPPCIYWLPLTEEQAKAKEEAKNQRKLEREKRNQQKEQEEAERRNKAGRSSRRSREKENRKSSTRSRSPVSRRR